MGATDIYIRRPQRSLYSENDVETNDMLIMFLQQIEMVLGTPPSTVLGKADFGVGLHSYLWDFNVGESELKQAINQQINLNCSLSGEFSYKIDVEFFEVGNSDSAVIDITVEDDNLVRMVVN
jgi:hypothetical protein